MRIQALLAAGLMVAFAACSGNNPTSPTSSGGTPTRGDVAVIVGNIFMKSGHNGSANPAVDTVAVHGTMMPGTVVVR
jgi:hypothetical protein